MAERKCGRCRQTGHTIRKCTADLLWTGDEPQRTTSTGGPLCGNNPNVTLSAGGQAVVDSVKAALKARQNPNVVTLGPEHEAQFPGLCEGCGNSFDVGDLIAPTEPFTGYVCANCYNGSPGDDPTVTEGHPDPLPDDVPLIGTPEPKHWDRPTAANVAQPVEPDAFTSPVTVSAPVDAAPEDAPESAQDGVLAAVQEPDAFVSPVTPAETETGHRTERLGYICKDPVLGDFRRYKNGNKKGITRTTTFVKAASDTYAIAQWNKRNVLLGAARRPDIVSRAYGLDVNQDRAQLDKWVEELEEAGGGSIASNMGTDVHKWTERIDAKLCTLDDVPPTYRKQVTQYIRALIEAELEVVPELRERTTFIEEFGGVAGTFDAILRHRPTDTYVLSDTKSGKNVGKYGWSEIEAQEFVYAHGYNRFGTYNWDTEEWEAPLYQVRMDYGLVIHIPFEGAHAGTCRLLRTDLQEGSRYANLCGSVRDSPKGKPLPWGLPAPGGVVVQARDWEAEFSSVQTNEQAASLWQQAKAAGIPLDRVATLVGLAQSALRQKS